MGQIFQVLTFTGKNIFFVVLTFTGKDFFPGADIYGGTYFCIIFLGADTYRDIEQTLFV